MASVFSRTEGSSSPIEKPRPRFISIRNRMFIAFILAATLPVVIVFVTASILTAKSNEANAINQLITVLDNKESTILAWVDGLQVRLHSQSVIGPDKITVASMLDPVPKTNDWMKAYTGQIDYLVQAAGDDQYFDTYVVFDPSGKVLYSNNQSLVDQEIEDEFYQDVLEGNRIYIGNSQSLGQNKLILTEPVKDNQNQTIGFVSGITNLVPIEDILLRGNPYGSAVETYLVDSDFVLLTRPTQDASIGEGQQIYTKGSINAIIGNQSGSDTYENYIGEDVVGVYRWIPELRAAIFTEQSRGEIFATVVTPLLINASITAILIFVSIVFGWYFANRIGKPIQNLSRTAQLVASGDITPEPEVSKRTDEVSILAESFNKMANQLQSSITDLEKRVTDRTSELESLTAHLLLASQLSSRVTSILDINELFQQAVNLIQDGFDLYYVGLFLSDETNTWALLKAGTGEEGGAMLKRGHRIKIGEGMIGWSIQNGKARIALNAGEDPVRLATPDLPNTRSEAAIPLRSRGLTIGALTIQSANSDAFDAASLTTFQTMADQIAVAIDNAQLFTEAKNSLEAVQRAYGEMSRKGWMDQLKSKPMYVIRDEQGVAVSKNGSEMTGFAEESSMVGKNSNGALTIPIKVRGTQIGKITAQKPDGNATWTDEEKEILNTLTEQLGTALDSARLFEETRTRAEREKLISQITNRVRETLDVETVLQTATIEIQKAFGLDEVEVRMSQSIAQET